MILPFYDIFSLTFSSRIFRSLKHLLNLFECLESYLQVIIDQNQKVNLLFVPDYINIFLLDCR